MHLKSKKLPVRLNRDERRQQTLEALRESALREFARFGVAGTSAERIAEAAGFTRGAFYANFDNKQSLLLELISERMAAEQTSWLELTESGLELDALLETLNERSLRFDPEGLWAMISAETYLYALRDPAFAEQYVAYHETTRSTFSHIIGNLFARAGKRSPVPLDDLCDAFLALSRSVRLPKSGAIGTVPQPMPPMLLITLLRGVIAIAPSID
ncbi:MAG: TetR family transcriptional regulator [Polaromonas sp.]|jgi:AcrR family transcriptional regulator|nr:TetR family transcriptional regulator [Polaromonas sp.]